TFDSSITTRGFTGHEMLDEVGVIHMNGRIYDAKIARFLQADPFIQDPLNTQSLNRYAYVWNNPLNATDPSGYFVFTLIAVALTAAEVAVGVYAIVAFGVAGFLDALVQGASFGDALKAGFSAAVLSAVGGQYSPGAGGFGWNPATFKYVAAMSITSGVTSVLQGGKFGHGFASAGLGAIAGGAIKLGSNINVAVRATVRAVIGGTVSKLSGGKFANGAISAAFSEVASDFGHSFKDNDSEIVAGDEEVATGNSHKKKESKYYTVDEKGRKSQTDSQRRKQFKDNNLKEGEITKSEKAEIKAVLSMDEVKEALELYWSEAQACDCEPFGVRVYRLTSDSGEVTYNVGIYGEPTPNGRGIRNIEPVVQFQGEYAWEHAFDLHAHPSGTRRPSFSDVNRSRNNSGQLGVIQYRKNRFNFYRGVDRK
ncbi:RHS repeat-associated core domain-containing protein, partial [Porticoccus sp. W117]|uniref:RHS repeat-associated core domain-containing protein n=1 Tax=Porticoccus sp. W117 TaxID=3054777 RepID=UPI0025966B9B